MKLTLSLLAITIGGLATGMAGGFGGPAPFRNNSPLPTGVDGQYQAVAKATNLSGIFSFQYRDGTQTVDARRNSWIFFIDGQIYRGSTTADISDGGVSGVLDGGATTTLTGTNQSGQIDLPAVFLIPSTTVNGEFNGSMDMNSPVGAFKGSGNVVGAPDRTDQIIVIRDTDDIFGSTVVVVPVTIPGSDVDNTKFKFRGTRLSIIRTTETPSVPTQGGQN